MTVSTQGIELDLHQTAVLGALFELLVGQAISRFGLLALTLLHINVAPAVGDQGGKSIAFLVAGLSIGLIVGPDRLTPTDPLFVGLFSGALTLFLIELGAIAANRLRDFNGAGIRVAVLAIIVPLINGSVGAVLGSAVGMSVGGIAVMATLAASASYIAAPAAIRIALPKASPGIYVTASLGITFPFNLIIGIPLYIKIAEYLG